MNVEGRFSCYLMGSESLLVQCAEILADRGHEIRGIASDDPAILAWAREHGFATLDPTGDLASEFAGDFDYLFSITNLRVLSDAVLRRPRRAAINFHDGPLPHFAGMYTPAWALMQREPRYGISWHVMKAELDEGDLLAERRFDVAPGDTSLTMNTKCYEAAIESFGPLCDALASGRTTPIVQDLEPEAVLRQVASPAGRVRARLRELRRGSRSAHSRARLRPLREPARRAQAPPSRPRLRGRACERRRRSGAGGTGHGARGRRRFDRRRRPRRRAPARGFLRTARPSRDDRGRRGRARDFGRHSPRRRRSRTRGTSDRPERRSVSRRGVLRATPRDARAARAALRSRGTRRGGHARLARGRARGARRVRDSLRRRRRRARRRICHLARAPLRSAELRSRLPRRGAARARRRARRLRVGRRAAAHRPRRECDRGSGAFEIDRRDRNDAQARHVPARCDRASPEPARQPRPGLGPLDGGPRRDPRRRGRDRATAGDAARTGGRSRWPECPTRLRRTRGRCGLRAGDERAAPVLPALRGRDAVPAVRPPRAARTRRARAGARDLERHRRALPDRRVRARALRAPGRAARPIDRP